MNDLFVYYFLMGEQKKIFNTYIAISKSIYLEALRLFGSDHRALNERTKFRLNRDDSRERI